MRIPATDLATINMWLKSVKLVQAPNPNPNFVASYITSPNILFGSFCDYYSHLTILAHIELLVQTNYEDSLSQHHWVNLMRFSIQFISFQGLGCKSDWSHSHQVCLSSTLPHLFPCLPSLSHASYLLLTRSRPPPLSVLVLLSVDTSVPGSGHFCGSLHVFLSPLPTASIDLHIVPVPHLSDERLKKIPFLLCCITALHPSHHFRSLHFISMCLPKAQTNRNPTLPLQFMNTHTQAHIACPLPCVHTH